MDIHFTKLLDQKETVLKSTIEERDKVMIEKKSIAMELEKNKEDLKFMEEAYDTLKKYSKDYDGEKSKIMSELKKLKTFNPEKSIFENVQNLTELQEKLNLELAKITFQLDKKSQYEENLKREIETLK